MLGFGFEEGGVWLEVRWCGGGVSLYSGNRGCWAGSENVIVEMEVVWQSPQLAGCCQVKWCDTN